MAKEIQSAKVYPGRQEGHEDSGAPLARRDLAEYSEGAGSIGGATVALMILASIHGASGLSAVLAGDVRGFADVDLACLYDYWQVRILSRGFDLSNQPDKHATVFMGSLATCWMHAEAVGALTLRRSLDKLVNDMVAGHAGVGGREMNALYTLVAHYATGRTVADLRELGWAPIGEYGRVADGTFTERDYDRLATFHQHQVEGGTYPPFHSYPYRLFPAELLAISRRTGIPIEGSHPLLTSPLARLRDVPEIPMTDELRAVVERAGKDLAFDPTY